MTLTIIILIVTMAMFVAGRLRADIVALCSLVVMLLCGILTPTEALAGFSYPVVVMMVGLFVVGGAILQTGLAKAASHRIMHLARGMSSVDALLRDSAAMETTIGIISATVPVLLTKAPIIAVTSITSRKSRVSLPLARCIIL